MAYEAIDKAKDKTGAFDKLVARTLEYLNSDMDSVGERLKLERDINKYSQTNSQDWLLNLIVCVYDDLRRQEKNPE